MPARTHLTFDEQQATEAAFHGWPVESKWSDQAQAMYRGILEHTQGRDIIQEAGDRGDEPDEYFVGPPRLSPESDETGGTDGDLPTLKRTMG